MLTASGVRLILNCANFKLKALLTPKLFIASFSGYSYSILNSGSDTSTLVRVALAMSISISFAYENKNKFNLIIKMNVTIRGIDRCSSLVLNKIHMYFFVFKWYSQQLQLSIFRIKKIMTTSKIFNQTRCIIIICKIHVLKMNTIRRFYLKNHKK